MTNKKIVLLAILFISLFAISTVNAEDNQTDEIIAVDSLTNDVINVDNTENENPIDDNENISENQELLTADESGDAVSVDNNDESLSYYYYTYPYYYNYDVNVYDTSIIYEDGGIITMNVNPASSDYTYRYYFYLKIYDSNDNQIVDKTYYSRSYSSSCTCSIDSYSLNPGTYTLSIINYYDDRVMDSATLTVTPRNTGDDSYYSLYNLISNADKGSTVNFKNDYQFDSRSSGISISKPLTIDGKGHSIDGADLSRIFIVKADNVTLKNIMFKNCNFNDGYYTRGGSIFWSGSNGILKNCEFVNCSVTSIYSGGNSKAYGGAVYWYGNNGKIDGCTFTNCLVSSKASGGSSYAYGGAVCWSANDGVINNCNFIDCLSDAYSSEYSSANVYSRGGAVYWENNYGVVRNSNFRQCYAQADASYSSSTKDSRGAAICWLGSHGLIDNSYFKNNSKSEKGVIYAGGDYLNVTSSLFLDNYKNNIYWTGVGGSITDSILISNPYYYPIYTSNYEVSADYNWWGNTVDDFDVKKSLSSNVIFDKWLYLDVVPDSPLKTGQTGKIKFSLNNLVSNGEVSQYNSKLPDIEVGIKSDDGVVKSAIISRGTGEISYTAVDTPNDVVDINVNTVKKQINITVIKGDSKIIAANLKTVYNGGKYLKATLNDKYGHIIKGGNLTVKLNGKTKKYVADDNGVIKISTNKLVPKTYTAKISFSGDKNYHKSSATAKITVKKATPKLTFSKQTVYDNVKKKSVSVTLKDKLGAVKKVKLSLVINGKTFTAKTNSNGVAVFKVTNLAKIGSYKATVKFAGNSKYNSVSKKSKVIVKKAPKYKIITIATKMTDSEEKVTKTYDNFVIQTEKFQHAATTLCVFVYKDGNMLKRQDYTARFQYNEAGVWKWTQWSHGTQAAVYYKIADSIPNNILVGNVQVKLKV